MIDFKNITKIHCIGIGGIGMSAVARMFLLRGKKVSGSDSGTTKITEDLKRMGAEVYEGHVASHVSEDVELVVYTIALLDENEELVEARRRNIPVISYPEALGIISRDKYTIAISGTHGKTTTTGMVANVLIEAGKSPTVIVGSLLSQHNSNFIPGESDIFVVEACEYRRSFLHLNLNILIITNIDNDHLDYYKDLPDIQSAFNELAKKVPADGFIIANPADPSAAPALEGVAARVIDYTKQKTDGLALRVPGRHNVLNAQAALAAACATSLDISRDVALKALYNFEGTWRRFEYKGKTENGAPVYDDYAHHPAEIKATLSAACEKFPREKIIVVFQPHLYSRTKLLLDEFAQSFEDADEVVIAPIYAAREEKDSSVNEDILVQKIKEQGKEAVFLPDFESIKTFLEKKATRGSVIFTMGAGDIFKIGESLIKT